MPVTYGLHLTRAYMRQAKEHGHSCAVILLDLKEAFYRILRPLCMDGPLTDEMLARLMHTLKMPEDALHELRKIMEEPTALREAGLPELEQRSVRAVHQTRRPICRYSLQLRMGSSYASPPALHETT